MVSKWFKDAKLKEYGCLTDHYDIIGSIGEGTYGSVFKARRKAEKDPNKFYAIKKLKANNSSDGLSISVCREIGLLRELKHENIVQVLEVHVSQDRENKSEVSIVFDCAEFDLWNIIHLREDKNPLPEALIKSTVFQMLSGINYLHTNWILHRDLKPANILIMTDGSLKIADIGMARLYNNPLRPLTDVDPVVVTSWYRAPEVLLGAKHYTRAIDLWAIGCIMAELIKLKPLFNTDASKGEDKHKDPYSKVQIQKIFSFIPFPTPTSPVDDQWPDMVKLPKYKECVQDVQGLKLSSSPLDFFRSPQHPERAKLVMKLLRLDPTQRITALQALSHPYFAQNAQNQKTFSPRSIFEDETISEDFLRTLRKQKPKESAPPAPNHTSSSSKKHSDGSSSQSKRFKEG